MSIKYLQNTAIKLLLILLIVAVTGGFMFGIKLPLSGEWKQRLSDVDMFNAYAEKHKVEIKDSKLDGIKLTGAKLTNAVFENTDWKDVTFFNSKIKNAHFVGGEYRNAAFQTSYIENTVFEGITFYNADFEAATLKNVKFIHCNFGKANFQRLRDSDLVFEGSVLEEVEFYESKVDIQYIKSKLTSIEMMGVKAKSSFVVKSSDVYDVDLGSSEIPHIEITDSTIKKASFSGGKADTFVMKDLKGAWQASGAKIGKVDIDHVVTDVLLFSGTHAKTIKVSNVTVTDSLNAKANADLFEIDNSDIKSIWNGSSRLKVFKIVNTELRGTRNESSKIGTFYLENVTLNGKFNFDGTTAQKLELVNVTKGPNFQFRGRDSNIHF